MAGDWIKMRADLLDDPAVFRMSKLLSVDRFSIVGRLHSFWAWVDRHSVDGRVDGATSTDIDEVVRLPEFSAALADVGWVEIDDHGLHLPHYERHNGESAKERGLKNARQARWRAKKAEESSTSTTHVDASPSTKASTREEKRREEKREVSGFDAFWKAYPKKEAKKDAAGAFAKLNPNPELLAVMLAAIATKSASTDWTKENGKYVPLPASWIRAERWTDEGVTLAAEPARQESFV